MACADKPVAQSDKPERKPDFAELVGINPTGMVARNNTLNNSTQAVI